MPIKFQKDQSKSLEELHSQVILLKYESLKTSLSKVRKNSKIKSTLISIKSDADLPTRKVSDTIGRKL